MPGATDRDRGYWRDVGTLDAYYDAHMDLVSVHPIFNLYNDRWPISTAAAPLPPAKFVEGGIAQDSIVGAGTIISGAIVRRSVISPNVRIDGRGRGRRTRSCCRACGSARGAVVRRAILDKNVVVPDGAQVGVDLATDRAALHRQPGWRRGAGQGRHGALRPEAGRMLARPVDLSEAPMADNPRHAVERSTGGRRGGRRPAP